MNTLGVTPDVRDKGQGVPLWFGPGDVAIFGWHDEHPRTHAVIAVAGAAPAAICNAHTADVNHVTIEGFYDANPSFDRCTFYHIPRGFSGEGSGTEQDPYVITNVDQLQEMNEDLDACYALGNDIDASATKTWNGGAGFVPIANKAYVFDTKGFVGQFDGKGYMIKDLWINRPLQDRIGLFSVLESTGYIKDVRLIGGAITGKDEVGGLAGILGSGVMANCHFDGDVTGEGYVGGLVGNNAGGGLHSKISTTARLTHNSPGIQDFSLWRSMPSVLSFCRVVFQWDKRACRFLC